tara:strand:+ start:490 stop:789 length:300 start_codon:yes stop_codon:yes gene_type:complete
LRVPTLAEVRREAQLIEHCFEHQGQYLDAHHPETSFSTKYGSQFVWGTRDLCELYRSQGCTDLDKKLSDVFQDAGIKSCRGEPMTVARVKYLLDAYQLR